MHKFLLISIISLTLIATAGYLAVNRQQTTNKAISISPTPVSKSIQTVKKEPDITLSLIPKTVNIKTNEITTIKLQIKSSVNNLKEFRTEVVFPKEYLEVPKGKYVALPQSSFKSIKRVDGPVIANQTGRIIINLQDGSNNQNFQNGQTLAIFTFKAVKKTDTPQKLSFDNTTIKTQDGKIPEAQTEKATFIIH